MLEGDRSRFGYLLDLQRCWDDDPANVYRELLDHMVQKLVARLENASPLQELVCLPWWPAPSAHSIGYSQFAPESLGGVREASDSKSSKRKRYISWVHNFQANFIRIWTKNGEKSTIQKLAQKWKNEIFLANYVCWATGLYVLNDLVKW